MNTYISKIILGLALITLTFSCSNDWLDEKSNMQLSAEEQFKSTDGFKDALMGVYLSMTETELYAKDMNWNLVDILSQQYAAFSATADYAGIQQFKYDTRRSVNQIEGVWSKAYNTIANINLALEMTETQRNVLGDIDYAIIRGELLGLRAFVHFDLLRLFGYGDLETRTGLLQEDAIPYVTVFSKNITSQVSYQETFALLQADLNEALLLLEEDPAYAIDKPADYYDEVNRTGFYNRRDQRMNYYAVKALKARVLQWEGKQTEAAAAAETVISNSFASLINSASYPVASDKIFTQELLFSLDIDGFIDIVNILMTANGDGSIDEQLFYTSNFIDNTFETNNINIGLVDVRYNTLMEQQTRGIANLKLVQGGSLNVAYNQMPIIKLPEMYYIAAEAYAKGDQLGTAINYLNILRSSRGILENIPETATQEEVLLEIKKEYKKEFLSEGQLFYYYKRTGATEIFGLSDNIELNDDVYVLPYPDIELQFGAGQ